MSLLIKALNKAEEAQAQNAKAEEAQNAISSHTKPAQAGTKQQKIALDSEVGNANLTLSLSPTAINQPSATPTDDAGDRRHIDDTKSNTPKLASANVSAKSAANIFSSKGMAPKKDSQLLAIIAGLALITLLGMGVYFYRSVNNTPEPITIPRVAQAQIPAMPLAEVPEQVNTAPKVTSIVTPPVTPALEPVLDKVAATLPSVNKQAPIISSNETVIFRQVKPRVVKKPQRPIVNLDEANTEVDVMEVAENTDSETDVSEPQVIVKKTAKSKTLKLNSAIASDSASIIPSGVSASKNKTQTQVSPTLMRAYNAYNAGNDAEAQKLYKQVLQHDIRNADALLGLGAIAQRQGRVADANGWFGKVLEVEPRNSIAQAAMLDNTTQSNDINSETHLKNMLAKQPDDANLHAELGNYYAAQNQWPSAQQAYFDAYRLHVNANNALNLAVSLDQIGKPKLALPYYQRALELAQTGSNSIDKAALEARIAALQ